MIRDAKLKLQVFTSVSELPSEFKLLVAVELVMDSKQRIFLEVVEFPLDAEQSSSICRVDSSN